ncbi:MAG: hypothetical protein IK101_07150 [Oscillospiraceae bacterium]|nr:hypothetical protein [Oscillospiraceae bacterium]
MHETYQTMQKIMQEKGYPVSVQETAIGTIKFARDKVTTAEKVGNLLKQNLTAREMVKALQPIIKEE